MVLYSLNFATETKSGGRGGIRQSHKAKQIIEIRIY
jgi:hypothetical protein